MAIGIFVAGHDSAACVSEIDGGLLHSVAVSAGSNGVPPVTFKAGLLKPRAQRVGKLCYTSFVSERQAGDYKAKTYDCSWVSPNYELI